MACKTVELDNGARAIVCDRGRKRRPACSVPGCGRPGTVLCDHPHPIHDTCDRLVCDQHSRAIGPDRHWCSDHPPA